MLQLLKEKFGGLLTTGWSFMRILRFVIGTGALIFAIRNHDVLLAFAGGLLLLMAVFNLGCCAMGSCSVPKNGKATALMDETRRQKNKIDSN